MFGQKTAFGAAPPTAGAFGSFGTAQVGQAATPFGAAPPNAGAFGVSAAPTFGVGTATPAAGGGLFGAPAVSSTGGLFGTPTATTSSAFGGGFGSPAASTSFGAGASAFKPAGGFGATPTAGFSSAGATGGGGMFGASSGQPSAGGLFGAAPQATAFGQAQQQASPFGFGQQQQQHIVGTTIKFNPLTGTDTMMKSGGQQNINTRHQCISCMKEYENKSLEELRMEDYAANRKGPAGGVAPGQPGSTGLFGAAPNQTAPGAVSGGLFGSPAATTQQQQQQQGLFGAQQKPLFGSTAGGFGVAASTAASPFGAAQNTSFGAAATSQAGGGLFGNKPAGFGATTTTSSTGYAFGAAAPQATSGGLFGQQQQKPFGATAGGLFAASTAAPGFGVVTAGPAFGTAGSSFGQQQNTSIGLFGQQQKPMGFGAPTTAFGAPAVAVSSAGAGSAFGFGAPTMSQAPFGQQSMGGAKPAFGVAQQLGGAPAFGAAGSAFGAPTSTSFGGAGAAPQPGGGLFGAKPSPFSFAAATSQPSAFGAAGSAFGAPGSTVAGGAFGGGAPGGGAFGAATSTGGGLFASAQQKPLFGGPTPSFGAGSAFGAAGTSFGAGTSSFGAFGGAAPQPAVSSYLGGGFNQQPQQQQYMQQQQQQGPNMVLQGQIAALTNHPYGDNPLFKNLLPDSNKREELLKPTNPAAQKALTSGLTQYKVSPHRGLKAKAKPISASSSGGSGNKSVIFDGLEDDDVSTSSSSKTDDMFVPRASVKKLVLRPKSPKSYNIDSTATTSVLLNESNSRGDESLTLPPPVIKTTPPFNTDVEDSFSNLNTKKKEDQDQNNDVTTSSESELQHDEISSNQPAGIKLKRAGYYTIPNMSELATMVDSEGNLNVENFTIGRSGYGNIFFPGVTNIKAMNFDDIVFFRHKEVIVYPDDENKPGLGEGLNKKAQVTLDKVWPVDKSSQAAVVKSPEKLTSMNYEDKLQKACIKLGARFVEYRPETGSWVFKVEHFSKYGLDESDEEADNKQQQKKPPLQVQQQMVVAQDTSSSSSKRLKTLQLRDQPQNLILERVHSEEEEEEEKQSSFLMEMSTTTVDQLARIQAPGNKVQLMKAALFDEQNDDDEDDEDMADLSGPPNVDISKLQQPKRQPVILERRRDKLIEEIAHSMLNGGSNSRGLGGQQTASSSFGLEPTITSSILRSQYLSMAAAAAVAAAAAANTCKTPKKSGSKKVLPKYSLTAGYEKYVSLPTSGTGPDSMRTVVAKHSGRLLPLKESILTSANVKNYADSSLFMSRHFRLGWSVNWTMANPGESYEKEAATDVTIEAINCNHHPVLIESLEAWLQVCLENSILIQEDDQVPLFEPRDGLASLHAHVEEAGRQLSTFSDLNKVMVETKQVWDLCMALWGSLGDDDEEDFEVTNNMLKADSHEVTVKRRDAFSKWLQSVVKAQVETDLRQGKECSNNHMDQILPLLSGNRLSQACDVAQSNGDHYAAMLMAQVGAANSEPAAFVSLQLDRWQEARADKHVDEKRLQLLSLISGTPVWPGTVKNVNTCENLDWKRALAIHLWYMTSPANSLSDALEKYAQAFQKDASQFGDYAAPPKPSYCHDDEEEEDLFDIKFHLLKLYANRAHRLESVVSTRTYTEDPLDQRLGWFVAQVLRTLGYRHMSVERADEHHAAFAAQLEAVGLWQWAVFVILYMSDKEAREKMAKDVLGRHVVQSDEESAEREAFLQDRLGVPLTWIAEAKAIRAAANRNYGDQAWYLIRAELWNSAHEVIVKRIAPDAIINDDYEFFYSLLKDLASIEDPASRITDWHTSGQVFYDFINVDMEVKELLRKRDEATVGYHIEKVKPQVISLCSRVKCLAVKCAKERLCQSEIAKKTAHLMRAVFSLENSGSGEEHKPARMLAQHLSQLPLPDDYVLQELRTLDRNYMIEIMES